MSHQGHSGITRLSWLLPWVRAKPPQPDPCQPASSRRTGSLGSSHKLAHQRATAPILTTHSSSRSSSAKKGAVSL